MKKPILLRLQSFFSLPKHQFILGLVVTLLVTLAEVIKWKQRNFFIYRNATLDMWAGQIPYGSEWTSRVGPDAFLYGPLFTLLFTPFAWLPPWLGPFLWNIAGFSLFFYAIRSLPNSFDNRKKTAIFFFIFLMMANNLMYYQYNLMVSAFFLLGFSLMEKGHAFGSILLIGLSGFTKIYGVFQYAFLLFYGKFWRNLFLFVLPLLATLALLPLIMMDSDHLREVYTKWVSSFDEHFNSRPWMSIFHFRLLFPAVPEKTSWFQLGSLAFLGLITLLRLSKSHLESFRAQTVGIMMGWVILFSNSPEIGTYLIAMTGLALWHFSRTPTSIDRWILMINFVVFMVIPQDVFFPRALARFLMEQWQIHILLFFLTWIRMITKTYLPPAASA